MKWKYTSKTDITVLTEYIHSSILIGKQGSLRWLAERKAYLRPYNLMRIMPP